MPRLLAGVTAAATGLTGSVVLGAAPAQADLVRTSYGFQSSAYGTRVISESVPLNISRSAFSWIGCTRRTGLNPDNHVTAGNYLVASDSDSNPWVRIGAVTTSNRTFKKDDGSVGSQAVSKIADVTLTGPSPAEGVPGPQLSLDGVVSTARTWARNGELHGATSLSSLDVALQLPEGTPVDEQLRQLLGAVDQGLGAVTDLLQGVEGNAIEVPGLGVVRLGRERLAARPGTLLARAKALVIDLAGADGQTGTVDDSRVFVGQAQSRISRVPKVALMTGHGYPLQMSLADNALSVGKVGMEALPCRGTDGKVLGDSLPAQNILDDAVSLGTLTAQVFGERKSDGGREAWTLGKVARVSLDGGRVQLAGIVGKARVYRKPNGDLVRSTKGTSIGSFTVDGEEQALPADGGPVELPGLGIIQFNLVERTSRGIALTAVRITLDPGGPAETVINLGNARTEIK